MMDVPDSAQQTARFGPLFIVMNAASGHKDSGDERRIISDVFTAAGRKFEFLEIHKPANIGVVVAAGGDSTVNAVAGAELRSNCPFGVLPQGTFNYFGRTNGIPQDAKAAAQALLGASISTVSVGEVNGRVFLVNASLGLYPQIA